MLERPDAGGLLEAAREVLLRELLPHLPDARRFEARMVANAMAIARREAAPESAADAGAVLARLRGLLDMPDAEPDALLRRLAAEVRAGGRDPGRPGAGAAAEALLALTRLRCGVSNPRALGGGGR